MILSFMGSQSTGKHKKEGRGFWTSTVNCGGIRKPREHRELPRRRRAWVSSWEKLEMSIPGRANAVREGTGERCVFKRIKEKNLAGARGSLGMCERMKTPRSRALKHFAQVHTRGCLPTTVRPQHCSISSYMVLLALYSHDGKGDTCPQKAIINDTVSSFRDQPRSPSFRCKVSFISNLSVTHIKTHHT